jgi:hypothetical protein
MRAELLAPVALVATAYFVIVSVAVAADNSSSNKTASGFFDQRFTWPINIAKSDNPAENKILSDKGEGYCYRAGDSLQQYGVSPTTDNLPNKAGYTRYIVTGAFKSGRYDGANKKIVQGDNDAGAVPPCPAKDHIQEGYVINVPNDFIKQNPQDWHGFAYGALTVPLKYQLTGKNDLTGTATLGPYIGYRWDRSGTIQFATEVVAFLGASNISVTQNVNGANATQNLFGISYGIGLLGILTGNLQAGFIFGYDHVATSNHYQYNDKPWIALSLGYSFAM